jgi:hypothetical protein
MRSFYRACLSEDESPIEERLYPRQITVRKVQSIKDSTNPPCNQDQGGNAQRSRQGARQNLSLPPREKERDERVSVGVFIVVELRPYNAADPVLVGVVVVREREGRTIHSLHLQNSPHQQKKVKSFSQVNLAPIYFEKIRKDRLASCESDPEQIGRKWGRLGGPPIKTLFCR